MKITKLPVIMGLIVFTAGTVFAITPVVGPVTYKFTASPDEDTSYNGSTITLDGTNSFTNITMTDWNLVGFGGPATPSNSGPPSTNFTFYDATTFDGSFSLFVPGTGYTFNGSNSAADGGFLGSSNFTTIDPPGIWAPVAAGVPDTGSALQLLGIGLGGLAAARRWVGARA